MQLSCIVVGGKPPPRVVWYKNSQLFSEQFVREEDVMTGQLVTYNNLSLLAIPRYIVKKLMEEVEEEVEVKGEVDGKKDKVHRGDVRGGGGDVGRGGVEGARGGRGEGEVDGEEGG